MPAKDHYVKSDCLNVNTHGEVPEFIYRIFKVHHLLNDINRGTLTLVNPCEETQGDPYENPLKLAPFEMEGGQHALFERIMSEYYTQSWSINKPAWGSFGDGFDTIRIKCRSKVLLERIMDENDDFYPLYYHIGLIKYRATPDISDSIYNKKPEQFLDSMGYGLLKTILTLCEEYENEREVRLVYIRSPRQDYDYPLKNKTSGIKQEYCAVHFDWNNVIEDYELNPSNRNKNDNIIAAITSSKFVNQTDTCVSAK